MFADSVIHGCGLAHQIKDLASIEHSPSEVRGREFESHRVRYSPSVHFKRPSTRSEREPGTW